MYIYLELLQQQLPESVTVNGAPDHLHVPYVFAQYVPSGVQVRGVKAVDGRAPHGGTALVEQLQRNGKLNGSWTGKFR